MNISIFRRLTPVVDKNAEKRQEHDARSYQYVPEDAVEGPTEQRSEQFEIAVDGHALAS
jgi:hypothetical protein